MRTSNDQNAHKNAQKKPTYSYVEPVLGDRMNQETRDKRAATQQEGERKKARTMKEPLKGVARMCRSSKRILQILPSGLLISGTAQR